MSRLEVGDLHDLEHGLRSDLGSLRIYGKLLTFFQHHSFTRTKLARHKHGEQLLNASRPLIQI
jgi:hypothetical protein